MDNNLKIEKILNSSYSIFRENYQQLFLISVIQSIISLYSGLFESKDTPILLLLYVAGMIIMVYLNLRLSITMIFLIKDRFNNSKSPLIELFTRSKEYIWKYLGATLMVAILVGLPAALFYMGFVLTDSSVIGSLSIIIGAVIVIYLASNFYLMPSIAILEPDNNTTLNRSIELTRKDRKMVVYTVSIIALLLLFPMIIPKLIGTVNLISRMLEILLSIIVYPLTTCIGVLLYFQLISDELEPTMNKT